MNREEFILNSCSDMKVLHLGCADWPFTEQRMFDGTWLHEKITCVSDSCIGIDNNIDLIEHLNNEYGVENVIAGDAERLGELDVGTFDIIVAGEIIEHLNNPGLFLESSKKVLSSGGKLIITTTNAFCLRRFVRIPFGKESIHPDHTYYFSHTTLQTLVTRFGFRLLERYSYTVENKKPLFPFVIEQIASIITPNWGEGIVHVYTLNQ